MDWRKTPTNKGPYFDKCVCTPHIQLLTCCCACSGARSSNSTPTAVGPDFVWSCSTVSLSTSTSREYSQVVGGCLQEFSLLIMFASIDWSLVVVSHQIHFCACRCDVQRPTNEVVFVSLALQITSSSFPITITFVYFLPHLAAALQV